MLVGRSQELGILNDSFRHMIAGRGLRTLPHRQGGAVKNDFCPQMVENYRAAQPIYAETELARIKESLFPK